LQTDVAIDLYQRQLHQTTVTTRIMCGGILLALLLFFVLLFVIFFFSPYNHLVPQNHIKYPE